jgi:hypothetical protein
VKWRLDWQAFLKGGKLMDAPHIARSKTCTIRQLPQTPEEKARRIERLKKKGLYISDLKQVPYLMMKRRLRMGLGSGTLTDAEMEVARSLGMC